MNSETTIKSANMIPTIKTISIFLFRRRYGGAQT